MSPKVEIGRRLREFGQGRYPSMSAFAEALGVSPSQINNYLSGRRTPGNKMQSRLRDLGCNIEWLMTGYTTYDLKRNPGGSVNDPTAGWIIPPELTGQERRQIIRLIKELTKLKKGDREKAIKVIKTIFPK